MARGQTFNQVNGWRTPGHETKLIIHVQPVTAGYNQPTKKKEKGRKRKTPKGTERYGKTKNEKERHRKKKKDKERK